MMCVGMFDIFILGKKCRMYLHTHLFYIILHLSKKQKSILRSKNFEILVQTNMVNLYFYYKILFFYKYI
jgi:hypothetical protein